MRLKKDNLKALLERCPESQRQFAKKVGVSVQAISSWLRGERNPKFVSVKRMADALNCEIEDIAEFKFPVNVMPVKRLANKKFNTYSIRMEEDMRNALEKWCDRNEMMVSQAIRLAVKRMINNKDFTVE